MSSIPGFGTDVFKTNVNVLSIPSISSQVVAKYSRSENIRYDSVTKNENHTLVVQKIAAIAVLFMFQVNIA